MGAWVSICVGAHAGAHGRVYRMLSVWVCSCVSVDWCVCVLVFVCNHLAAKDCIVATEWVRMTVR